MSSLRRVHGPTLRAIRQARGLRGDHVARKAGISKGFLSNIEAGRRSPEAARSLTIARAVDVPLEVLTGQKPVIGIIREALGIPATSFARDIGVTTRRLAQIEGGSEIPNDKLTRIIATRLGVDPAALLHYAYIAAVLTAS